EGGRVPGAGARVQVRAGHAVVYDFLGDAVIRSIHVAGTPRFDPQRGKRPRRGLVKIPAGGPPQTKGFSYALHPRPGHGAAPPAPGPGPSRAGAALEVGTPDQPIAGGHTALIRLTAVLGLDPDECPAIVCCGGRMDFHGAELGRSWVKLGATAAAGATAVIL